MEYLCRRIRAVSTSSLLYGVIFGGNGALPKGQINPVNSMITETGRCMENKATIECPYCGTDLGNPSGCYKIKCDTCGAILSGCHK